MHYLMLTTHCTEAFECTLHSLPSGAGERESEIEKESDPYCKQLILFFIKHRIVSQNTFLLRSLLFFNS